MASVKNTLYKFDVKKFFDINQVIFGLSITLVNFVITLFENAFWTSISISKTAFQ